MKLLLLTIGVSLTLFVLILRTAAQNAAPETVKQIAVAPLNDARGGARLAALNIERGAAYPSVVHLNGQVEIRTNGFILRADNADYNETTGEVEAHGSVKVTPYPALK
jgi:lipopolysaccharide assembly outer membrane protein LptD (OstA)